MVSFRALLAAAPLLALAAASNIAFTSTPADAVAGNSYNITWAGGDSSGVTLILRQGNPQDLSTVDTIADNVDTDYYVWTVPSDLEAADDYALQIVQGQTGINYSGLFTISGGSNSTSSTASSTATATSNSTASVTGMASGAGTSTVMSRNSTFSTASLSSASSTYDFNSMTSTGSGSSATRMPSSASTSAPSNDAPVRAGSSAALVLGIVAAVMLH